MWEYEVIVWSYSEHKIDDINKLGIAARTALNKMGENGWEFVSSLPADKGQMLSVFKRPKTPEPTFKIDPWTHYTKEEE